METSFSRHYWSASAMLNRVCNVFRTPPGATNSQHLLPYFVSPVLLEFLQAKHNTPFETHPISMCVATASFLAYSFANEANLRFSARHQFSPTCLNIVRFSTSFFGQLSLASLATVLFPNSVAFIPYVLYVILAVGELLYCVYYRTMGDELREWLLHGRFGLLVVQQWLLSLWTSMVGHQLTRRAWHLQERLGLLEAQQWLIMRLYHFREWLFHGRLGQVVGHFMSLMRLWRRRVLVNHGVNQTHLLPVYRAPRL